MMKVKGAAHMKFPTGYIEELALLYTQQQDISRATPAEIYEIYADAYSQICAYIRAQDYQYLANILDY